MSRVAAEGAADVLDAVQPQGADGEVAAGRHGAGCVAGPQPGGALFAALPSHRDWCVWACGPCSKYWRRQTRSCGCASISRSYKVTCHAVVRSLCVRRTHAASEHRQPGVVQDGGQVGQ